MRFDVITIFPEFFSGPLDYGIVRRAREARLIESEVHDLRDFTHDRHRSVDDRPFGGGEGMVMKPGPIFEAVESLLGESHSRQTRETAIVLLSAAGKLFCQQTARQFAKLDRILLICGRYEGVDERVAEHLATDEISIGDFVLSGGELPAAMILDAVTRLVPGALGNQDSTVNESFSTEAASRAEAPDTEQPSGMSQGEARLPKHHPRPPQRELRSPSQWLDDGARGILDYPHYTRPQAFRGWEVPEVLMSGNHEEIRRWRHQRALEKTRRNRPDLLSESIA